MVVDRQTDIKHEFKNKVLGLKQLSAFKDKNPGTSKQLFKR